MLAGRIVREVGCTALFQDLLEANIKVRGKERTCALFAAGAAFDIRRLCASPGSSSGLVSLEALEAVQREADFAERAGAMVSLFCATNSVVDSKRAKTSGNWS